MASFGTSAFGTSGFSKAPFYNTKTLIDEVLKLTGVSGPNVSQDSDRRELVLTFLNNTYAEILSRREWRFLLDDTSFTVEEPYDTGSATFTKGSQTVDGKDSAWTAVHADGREIWPLADSDNASYKITDVNSEILIEIEAEFAKDTITEGGYKIVKSRYKMPQDVEHIQSVILSGYHELEPLGLQDFKIRQHQDERFLGPPRFYTVIDDKDQDGQGNNIRKIEIYPTPDKRYQLKIIYSRVICPLTDSVESIPLIPDKHRQTLFWGAVAQRYLFKDDSTNARLAEAKYKENFVAMLNDIEITDSHIQIMPERRYFNRRSRSRFKFIGTASDFLRR